MSKGDLWNCANRAIDWLIKVPWIVWRDFMNVSGLCVSAPGPPLVYFFSNKCISSDKWPFRLQMVPGAKRALQPPAWSDEDSELFFFFLHTLFVICVIDILICVMTQKYVFFFRSVFSVCTRNSHSIQCHCIALCFFPLQSKVVTKPKVINGIYHIECHKKSKITYNWSFHWYCVCCTWRRLRFIVAFPEKTHFWMEATQSWGAVFLFVDHSSLPHVLSVFFLCAPKFRACNPRAHRPFNVSSTLSYAVPSLTVFRNWILWRWFLYRPGSCLLWWLKPCSSWVTNESIWCMWEVRARLSSNLSDTRLLWKMQWCCRIPLHTKDSTKEYSGACAFSTQNHRSSVLPCAISMVLLQDVPGTLFPWRWFRSLFSSFSTLCWIFSDSVNYTDTSL